MAIQRVARHYATSETTERASDAPPASVLPPLENGDRLTRSEFERRYESMPDLKKAELIEGVVYVGSPVRYTQHGQPNLDLDTWIGVYRASTPGVAGAGNTTVRGVTHLCSRGV